MSPINELKDEHQAVKLTLSILEKVSTNLNQGKQVELDHLDQLLEFLTTFVDKCHHGKEEDLLFPLLEQAGIPREGGPIGVMLHEHDLGRGYIKGIREGMVHLKAGDSKPLVANITNYIELLTRHIDKEDQILYPIAERSFTEEQNNELLKGFAVIEEQRVGAGKHEEFHRMLHRLQQVYL